MRKSTETNHHYVFGGAVVGTCDCDVRPFLRGEVNARVAEGFDYLKRDVSAGYFGNEGKIFEAHE